MVKGLKGKIFFLSTVLAVSTSFATVPEVVPGEYVVQLKGNSASRVMMAGSLIQSLSAQSLNASIKRFIPNTNLVVLNLKDKGNTKATVAALLENEAVALAEPNFIYRINRTPNDPELGKLWGLINSGQKDSNKAVGVPGVDIGAEKAWDIQTGNQELVVAVIDTGVDYNHKDLKGNVWTNDAELNGKQGVDDDQNGFVDDIHGYDFANRDGDPMDDHGHGSHCSGTIGAKGDDNAGIVGVAWNVRIMGVKFLSKDGSGSLEDAVESIKYATKMGAKIMSNSWGGGGYSDILKDAIQEASDKGVVFTFR
jgi:subtilisin family serine protease